MVLAVDKFMRLNQRRRLRRFGDDEYQRQTSPSEDSDYREALHDAEDPEDNDKPGAGHDD